MNTYSGPIELPRDREELRKLATRFFVAKTREEAIAQNVLIAVEHREFSKTCASGPQSLTHKIALSAIKRAKRIAREEDWRRAYINTEY